MSLRSFGLKPWHAVFFIVALTVCAIALAPISLLLPQRPGVLTYERAEGAIWSAKLHGVRIGDLDAGIVDWRFDPSPILSGALGGRLTFNGQQLRGDLAITYGADGVRRIRSDRLTVRDASVFKTPVKGETTAPGLDIAFAKDACATAAGALKSDLADRPAGLQIPALSLSGTALCGDAEAWLPLEGDAGGERVRIVIALRANGEAKWQADIVPASVESAAALTLAGFAAAPGEPYLRQTRTFRWLPF